MMTLATCHHSSLCPRFGYCSMEEWNIEDVSTTTIQQATCMQSYIYYIKANSQPVCKVLLLLLFSYNYIYFFYNKYLGLIIHSFYKDQKHHILQKRKNYRTKIKTR